MTKSAYTNGQGAGRTPARPPSLSLGTCQNLRRTTMLAGPSERHLWTGATTDIEQDAIELHPGVADQVEVLDPGSTQGLSGPGRHEAREHQRRRLEPTSRAGIGQRHNWPIQQPVSPS